MAKPASVSDIKFSQEGEPAVQETQFDPQILIPGKESSPVDKWIIFKLVKSKKGRLYVDGCDDVLVNGKTERIWLLNGVHSIWQRELVDIIKDKDFMRTHRRSLEFKNNYLMLPSWDTLAIEFARTTRHNVKVKGNREVSKHAFYEYDPSAQQKQMLEAKMTKIKATTEASLMPVADMIKHASFLGVSFIDEIGRRKSDDGIRTEYIIKADNDPVYWNTTKGSPEVERSFLIKAAIIDSKIDSSNGAIRWTNNGGFVCNQPVNKSIHDCLLELAMSYTPEGKAFLEKLQTSST